MDDAAFMDALQHGPLAPLEVYRRAYATVGVPWPGEQEVRRRHRISDTGTGPQPPAAQRLAAALGWAEVPEFSEEGQQEFDAEFEAAQAQARRRASATASVPWPGGEEVRRRHPVTGDDDTTVDAAGSITRLMRAAAEADQAAARLRELAAVQRLFQRVGRVPTEQELGKVAQIVTAAQRWRARDAEVPDGGRPLGSVEDLVQPGMFDSDGGLQEFLADPYATGRASVTVHLVRDQVGWLHQEVGWLRRAVQALLDHHGISHVAQVEDDSHE